MINARVIGNARVGNITSNVVPFAGAVTMPTLTVVVTTADSVMTGNAPIVMSTILLDATPVANAI